MGEVTARHGRILISAELIDAPSGATLWKQSFDRAGTDIFALWDQIATAVVDDGLHLRLTREERVRQLIGRPTNDVEADHLFLRARPLQISHLERPPRRP